MKSLKAITFSLLLLTGGSTITFAQTASHSHHGPHNGVVQEADGYHIEMFKTKDTLNFCLLDAKGKTSDKKATGKVEYEFSNNTKASANLVSGKSGVLQTGLPKANIFEFCTVTLTVDGKTVSAKFKNNVTDAEKAHGHQH